MWEYIINEVQGALKIAVNNWKGGKLNRRENRFTIGDGHYGGDDDGGGDGGGDGDDDDGGDGDDDGGGGDDGGDVDSDDVV